MAQRAIGRLYEVAERQREAILAGERAAASQLVETFGGMWQRIRREIDDLLGKRAAAEAAGEVIGPEWLYRQNRLETLLSQVERELRIYAEFASPLVTNAQGQAIDMALWHSEELVRAATRQVGIGVNWNRLPLDPLKSLIGFTSNGSPLRAMFDRLGPETSQLIRDGLIQGLALGWNPERIAGQLRDYFARGLSQSLTTCRTEVMRAYREGTHNSYQENDDILTGWVWNCACTSRSCAMCWAMHGTQHPLTERLDDHPNGRCVALPVVRPIQGLSPQWLPESGEAQFKRLNPATQANILGPLYELYEKGEIRLADVVGRKFDPDWGSMRFVRSKKTILEGVG